MRPERGSVTLWMLGLSLLLLLFGGIAVDFWRALAVQRELAAVADSAAVAGASGIDEAHYRATGEVLLDPGRAEDLGRASIAQQDVDPVVVRITASSDRESVTVVLLGTLDLGLLGAFVDETEPLTVRAEATAAPRLLP